MVAKPVPDRTRVIEIIKDDYHTDYVGTGELLIEAGLITAEMVPRAPKRLTYGGTIPYVYRKRRPADEPFDPSFDYWELRRIKGGRLCLRRSHARREQSESPMQWSPADFRIDAALSRILI